ncbi:hypothetical protein RP20_CCG002634 [Aedes albopictus]|nr:hypothetical protein RP20_CCG002634 [Aedes albopictus]
MITSLPVVQLLAIVSVIGRGTASVVRRDATRRLADIKCKEYSELAKSTYIYCSPDDWETLDFPHQATLGRKQLNYPYKFVVGCGGSLISDRFVLTAAHCVIVANTDAPNVVRLGAVDHEDTVCNCEADFSIERSIIHPNYTSIRSYHDIALVKLNETVEFTLNYRPACLWTSMNLSFTSVFATGFGATEDAGNPSNVLNMVELNIMQNDVCVKQFARNRKQFPKGIIGEQLCIGALEKGDTCSGDSGGPAQVIRQKRGCLWYVVGVTSTGCSCGKKNTPAIYTRVASYIDWIEQEVWGNETNVLKTNR